MTNATYSAGDLLITTRELIGDPAHAVLAAGTLVQIDHLVECADGSTAYWVVGDSYTVSGTGIDGAYSFEVTPGLLVPAEMLAARTER